MVMPTKPKPSRPAAGRSRPSPLAAAQADVLARFDRMITESLGPLLGKAGLARVRRDLAIATSVGGGVVVHAGLKPKGAMTLERIAKEKPIVGVLANSIPLVDPVSLVALQPGAYVVRLRAVGEHAMAFDFFTERSRPVLSTLAEPTRAVPTGRTTPFYGLIDVDLDFPWDPDGMIPPPDDGTSGKLCFSFLIWKHCWRWDWPDIDWHW
jgi:hypothetical protein